MARMRGEQQKDPRARRCWRDIAKQVLLLQVLPVHRWQSMVPRTPLCVVFVETQVGHPVHCIRIAHCPHLFLFLTGSVADSFCVPLLCSLLASWHISTKDGLRQRVWLGTFVSLEGMTFIFLISLSMANSATFAYKRRSCVGYLREKRSHESWAVVLCRHTRVPDSLLCVVCMRGLPIASTRGATAKRSSEHA